MNSLENKICKTKFFLRKSVVKVNYESEIRDEWIPEGGSSSLEGPREIPIKFKLTIVEECQANICNSALCLSDIK